MLRSRYSSLKMWSYLAVGESAGSDMQLVSTLRKTLTSICTYKFDNEIAAGPPKWSSMSFDHHRNFKSVPTVVQEMDKMAMEQMAEQKQERRGTRESVKDQCQEFKKALELADEGPNGILKVVAHFVHSGDFCARNVAQAFKQLAKVALEAGMNEDELAKAVHRQPDFQSLVDMAIATACSMSCQEITEVCASVGRLHYGDQMLLDRLTQSLIGEISSLGPEHILNTAEGLKDADHSPSKVLFDELKVRADELSDTLSTEQQNRLQTCYQHFGYNYS